MGNNQNKMEAQEIINSTLENLPEAPTLKALRKKELKKI